MKKYEYVILRMQLVKRTISLPQELLENGAERAKEDGRNFSSYVQKLIRQDLAGKLLSPSPKAEGEPNGSESLAE